MRLVGAAFIAAVLGYGDVSVAQISDSTWLTQFGAVTDLPGADNNVNSSCSSVVTDNSGNVYCIGDAVFFNNQPYPSGFVAKLNTEGVAEWVTQISLGFEISSYPWCLSSAIDFYGNIYCAGTIYNFTNTTGDRDRKGFVVKLNSEGVIQWFTQIEVDAGADENLLDRTVCYDIAVDIRGKRIYCAGSRRLIDKDGNSSTTGFVVKLNPKGKINWLTTLEPEPGSDETSSCHSVAVDSITNSVYCGGNTSENIIMKLNSTGEIKWVKPTGLDKGLIDSVHVDLLGNVYSSGVSLRNAFVEKFSSDGERQWATEIEAGRDKFSSCQDVVVDLIGESIYCAGYTQGNLGEANGGRDDAFVMKLNSDGEVQWITQLGAETTAPGGDNKGDDQCYGVAVDFAGNVYCAGGTTGSLGEANARAVDAFIMKLNPDGKFNTP